MLDKLDRSLHFQQEALHLLTRRQEVLAANIANADTPGYQARDIDFTRQLKQAITRQRAAAAPISLACTARGHIAAQGKPTALQGELLYRIPDQPSADGNTVDMDRERVNFADNSIRYQSTLTLLGAQIKSMMTVLQG